MITHAQARSNNKFSLRGEGEFRVYDVDHDNRKMQLLKEKEYQTGSWFPSGVQNRPWESFDDLSVIQD